MNKASKFIWDHWEAFFENIDIEHDLNRWCVSCKKGLWSVEGKNIKAVIREASRYYRQYWLGGEYDD